MKSFLIIILGSFLTSWAISQELRFTNPISDEYYIQQQLFPFKVESDYYFLVSGVPYTDTLTLLKSPILANIRNASEKRYNMDLPSWSSLHFGSVHEFNGDLYLYYRYSRINYRPQFYAIKAKNASDPMGDWEQPVLITTSSTKDNYYDYSNVMKHGDKKYFISCGWRQDSNYTNFREIYIAEMLSPTEVGSNYVLLHHPESPHECYDLEFGRHCSSSHPSFLHRNNLTYMIFSVGATFQFGLSQMSIPFEKDPMLQENWSAVEHLVFDANEEEDVYGPGWASFVDSPDGTETWMLYFAHEVKEDYSIKTPRLEKMDWERDGRPRFPRAHGRNNSQVVPSGQS